MLVSPRRASRKIPKAPYKVLDAPDLQDDYYLNLLDWSSLNVLSVGLGSTVYLWNTSTCQVIDFNNNNNNNVHILYIVASMYFVPILFVFLSFSLLSLPLSSPLIPSLYFQFYHVHVCTCTFTCTMFNNFKNISLSLSLSLSPQVSKLCDLDDDRNTVTSVSWSEKGHHLAIGTHKGYVQIWDAANMKHTHSPDTWEGLVSRRREGGRGRKGGR